MQHAGNMESNMFCVTNSHRRVCTVSDINK